MRKFTLPYRSRSPRALQPETQHAQSPAEREGIRTSRFCRHHRRRRESFRRPLQWSRNAAFFKTYKINLQTFVPLPFSDCGSYGCTLFGWDFLCVFSGFCIWDSNFCTASDPAGHTHLASPPRRFFQKMNDVRLASWLFFGLAFAFTHFNVRLLALFHSSIRGALWMIQNRRSRSSSRRR